MTGIVAGNVDVDGIVKFAVTDKVVRAPLTTPVTPVSEIPPVCTQAPDTVTVPVTTRSEVPVPVLVADVGLAPRGSVVLAATVS